MLVNMGITKIVTRRSMPPGAAATKSKSQNKPGLKQKFSSEQSMSEVFYNNFNKAV